MSIFNIEEIYLFLSCAILAMLYKITSFIEQKKEEAISKKELIKFLVVLFIYGVFGGILGVSVYLTYDLYYLAEPSSKSRLLGYLIAGMVGTTGTQGISMVHRYLDRRVSK